MTTPAETRATSGAFFVIEGALAQVTLSQCAAWFALRHRDIRQRAWHLGALALRPLVHRALPADSAADQALLWAPLDGCSHDRLEVLAADFYEDVLRPALRPAALDLLRRAHDHGQRVVLLSALPHRVLGDLADLVGADELLANTLETNAAGATGRLVPPVFSGRVDGGWLHSYAAQHGLDPRTSAAYGARAADATLLSAVGRPCAIAPDATLRRLAADHRWPVVLGTPDPQ